MTRAEIAFHLTSLDGVGMSAEQLVDLLLAPDPQRALLDHLELVLVDCEGPSKDRLQEIVTILRSDSWTQR